MSIEYFQSALFAAEMDAAWLNSVRSDKDQDLSETQKAQARDNIGAASFGSMLTILGHYNTVEALQANGEQKVGNAYSVGASVPYKLYIFDGMTESWLDYGYIRSQDINARCVQNVAIAKSAWSQDTTALPGYSYKARITLADSTVDSFPIVVFESEQAFSGNFAPMSFAFAGYLEVFAKSIPTKDINIVTATVIVGGGAGKGITNASATIANKSIKRGMLADDSLYSPNVHLGVSNAAFSLSSGSVGKTFIANNSATDFVITVPADTSIPTGFEVALLRFSCKSMKITFASGIKVLVYGNNSPLTAPSFTLETYAMVALKKISTSDYWLLTGPAEVV